MTAARALGTAFTPLPADFYRIVARQQERLDELRKQEVIDRRKRHRRQRDSTWSLFAGFATALIGTLVALFAGPDAAMVATALLFFALFLLVAGGYGLAGWWIGGEPLSWHEKNREQRRLQELRDMLLPVDARAERQLTDHRNELDEYYRQARSQSQTIFVIGIGVLFFSFALVGALLLAVISDWLPEGSELSVSVVTLVSVLMTDLVAAIYLTMFDGTQKNLIKFHERLARANSLYFANVAVARIPDVETRSSAAAFVAAEASRFGHRADDGQAPDAPEGSSEALQLVP